MLQFCKQSLMINVLAAVVIQFRQLFQIYLGESKCWCKNLFPDFFKVIEAIVRRVVITLVVVKSTLNTIPHTIQTEK